MTRMTLSTLTIAAVLAAAVTGSEPAEARRKVLVIGDLNAYGKSGIQGARRHDSIGVVGYGNYSKRRAGKLKH